MPEYELLELLLFNAIDRIDVKPLAKALLAAFGDLNGVVAASEPRLLEVPGTTPQGVPAAPDRRGLRAPDGAGAGDPAVGDRVVGRADDLLPDGDGLSRHRAVPHPVPRPQERADRRRGAGQGHGRPCAGLSARGGQARARTQCLRAHPRAQPSFRRPDAERRRHRHDRTDRARLPGDRGRAARPRGGRARARRHRSAASGCCEARPVSSDPTLPARESFRPDNPPAPDPPPAKRRRQTTISAPDSRGLRASAAGFCPSPRSKKVVKVPAEYSTRGGNPMRFDRLPLARAAVAACNCGDALGDRCIRGEHQFRLRAQRGATST